MAYKAEPVVVAGHQQGSKCTKNLKITWKYQELLRYVRGNPRNHTESLFLGSSVYKKLIRGLGTPMAVPPVCPPESGMGNIYGYYNVNNIIHPIVIRSYLHYVSTRIRYSVFRCLAGVL